MKTFKKFAAQGELDIEKIDHLPNGLAKVKPVNGVYIIGHSETGHNHVIDATRAEVWSGKDAKGMECLYAILKDGAKLEHQRDFDTHESIGFDGGDVVKFTPGQEHDHYAELARKQAD
jgi:hypothetical protein